MRENIRFLVFWARLTSLRMMFSNSIHLPVKITLEDPSTPIVVPQYPLGREGHMGLKLIMDLNPC
jgi:hypothetical protein